MSNSQGTSKDPRALFDEIDALCAEINEAALDEAVKKAATIHDVTAAQEARERAKRQHAYAELLACAIVDIEIRPHDVPGGRASLAIRSSAGVFSASVEIAECYGLVEFLSTRGFSILAAGKLQVAARDKRDEDQHETWFIIGKVQSAA